jgi:hypothetical protein
MQNTIPTTLKSILLLITLVFSGFSSLLAQSGIYAGGPVYKYRNYAINELKSSGFTYVVVWTIHINASGDLNFNAEFPLSQNGAYVGNTSYPNFASDIASLKLPPTSINRVEFCLSAWGSSTFTNIRNLVNSQGTGPNSILYKNFMALRNTFPTVDAIGFDDESTYDVSTATAFAVMLGNMGFKISLVPYTAANFWTSVATNTNNQRPGTVDRIDLQCYAGGAGNTPCSWNFGGIPIYPGLWDTEKTTSQVQSQLNTWKNQCSIQGGFIWLYDDIDNSPLTAQYAAAINNVFNGPPQTAAATFYKHCNYGGSSASLPAGNYTLANLNAYGILNEDISSIKVNAGYKVTVYWNDNFLGTTLQVTADNPCLVDEGWNDQISSLKIAPNTQNLNDNSFAIHPNPVEQALKITTNSTLQGKLFVILNKAGQEILRGTIAHQPIDVSALPPDIYVIRVGDVSHRFIKR